MKVLNHLINNFYIKEYYYQSFDNTIENTGIIIDDGCFEYIFINAKKTNIYLIHNHKKYVLPNCFTLNHMSPPFKFQYDGQFTAMGIKFQPWANSLFVPDNLNSGVVDLTCIYGKELEKTTVSILENFDFNLMISHFDKVLNLKYEHVNDEIILIQSICLEIHEKNGIVSITELSKKHGISRQTLNKLFKKKVKYSIKYYSRLIRTRAAIAYARNNPNLSLTDVSYKYGYFDQSHFINDCKNLIGYNPLLLIKKEGYSLNK